ncbi:MAG TPA: 4Fe-4S dicluster domain-containing protein [Candidatus Bathyarchaeota archaeon]|nr:4Fe-4S dicluster domain-containing protein [Candidatus Bathyarchaeota archaeon]
MAISVDIKACSGCGTCELVCALKHFGVHNPRKSAIRIMPPTSDRPWNVPVVCRQCAKPKCAEECPVNAIYKAEGGVVLVDQESCIGCRACAEACPFGAIFFHPEVLSPIKCDLCGGEPECVKWCPTGALSLKNPLALGDEARQRTARAMTGVLR